MAAPETDEPRIIDLEEGDLWQEHKTKVILAIALTLAASLGGGWWYQHQAEREASAWAAYTEGKTPEARAALLQNFPGSSAAASALLQSAREALAKKDYAAASGQFKAFVDSFPRHPSRPAADLGRAEAAEAAGDLENASHGYQQMLDAGKPHPYRGAAAIGLARIYKSQNKIQEAREVLDDYVNSAPQDPYFPDAKRTLSMLPPAASSEVDAPRPPQ